ncbi:MAG: ferritin family protein [Bacteroidales bacterium]|nr:ferritin family protein [Bacteroidales bacterium]
MENSNTLEILKTAILLERRGKAFYTSVANQAQDEDVKQFFMLMAKEEDDHIAFLTEQFAHYVETKEFKKRDLPKEEENAAEEILSAKMKDKISAASFEASAIAAAIDFETRAVKVYSQRAESATDPEEKKFYKWLAEWEMGHHQILHELDQQLKEKVWNDNNFWPF